jgi:hypothetical protein
MPEQPVRKDSASKAADQWTASLIRLAEEVGSARGSQKGAPTLRRPPVRAKK